ncbi:MAG: hypothetical protein QM737_16780 [Ferruginibacter sp.]
MFAPPIGEPSRFHCHAPGADAVNVTVPPHCVTGPAGVMVGVAGTGLIVTIALPVKSAGVAVHTEPFKVAIV